MSPLLKTLIILSIAKHIKTKLLQILKKSLFDLPKFIFVKALIKENKIAPIAIARIKALGKSMLSKALKS